MARIEGIAGENEDQVKLKIRQGVAYAVLILLMFISLLPFYLLLINATRGKVQPGIKFIPEGQFFKNIGKIFNDAYKANYGSFIKSFFNSIFVSSVSTVLCVYFSALTAYAVHVYDFKLKKSVHTFILLVMMVPTQASAIGLYRMLVSMKLTNSFIPLTIPAIAAPATYFFMIQYMASALPLEIVEAARMDGCGEYKTFNIIVLPILKPALAVQAIFVFVSNWNNLFLPQMLLDDQSKKTIPVVLQLIKANIDSNPMTADAGLMNMFMVLAILPVVIIYLLLSKNIVGGVSLGAVKG
ncbi:MAG: carbohydrate ABC transporter permease [Ruminococcus sp.]|nr:carbohydrate ABC transporter permease [Ruminococcus sp.]